MDFPLPRSNVALAGGLGRFDLSCWAWVPAANRARLRHKVTNITDTLRIVILLGSIAVDGLQGSCRNSGKLTVCIEPDLRLGCKSSGGLNPGYSQGPITSALHSDWS